MEVNSESDLYEEIVSRSLAGARARRKARYLGPAALAVVLAAAVVVALAAHGRSWWVTSAIDHLATGHARQGTQAQRVRARSLPPYWTVRPGNTLAQIARSTGLTLDQLQAFNPTIDSSALVPGERLNLWANPPRPGPKPLGPRFWTVQPGQSFGLIAAKTGISLTKLEQLNPRLKPATLQPGDKVRLR